jgi:hypothetical protein
MAVALLATAICVNASHRDNIEKAIEDLTGKERMRLRMKMSNNDFMFYDNRICVRAYSGALIVSCKKNKEYQSKVIFLATKPPKQEPTGKIKDYYERVSNKKDFGTPQEGPFDLFDGQYQIHIFTKGYVITRLDKKARTKSTVFKKSFRYTFH